MLPKLPNVEVRQLSSSSETTTPVVDLLREQMLEAIKLTLGEALVDSHLKPGDDLWIRVHTDSWLDSVQKLRDQHSFDYFGFLSAIDWMPSPFGRGEDDPTEPTPVRDTIIRSGYAGGETRMQVFIRLVNSKTHFGITVKVDVADSSPSVESLISILLGQIGTSVKLTKCSVSILSVTMICETCICRSTSRVIRCAKTSRCWHEWSNRGRESLMSSRCLVAMKKILPKRKLQLNQKTVMPHDNAR